MAWKQDPIYSNMETDGIYTRPKIDATSAYISGLNGGTYGQFTHQHSAFAAGQAARPRKTPVTTPSGYSTSGGGSTNGGTILALLFILGILLLPLLAM
ncbi:hypothetical protein [Roseovarius sp. MMSF_3350]|uniref:hypothetical protein n=1 Tax=Roseovarius sp. MMSF_3350 TaxID=3046706 RepID=UPI00273DEA71|nr:hypothetical protein [Roseovarius sp. MMSF_3350]